MMSVGEAVDSFGLRWLAWQHEKGGQEQWQILLYTSNPDPPSDGRANTWLGNGRGHRAASTCAAARPIERCERQASGAHGPEPSTRCRRLELRLCTENRGFHCCNRTMPFASSVSPFRADVLRYRLLQRVVCLIASESLERPSGKPHRVSAPHPRGGVWHLVHGAWYHRRSLAWTLVDVAG